MDRNIENILDTGGRSLSMADRQFVSTLFSELEQFQHQAPKDRALMFHPLGGYQRYLIHKVTEIFPKLTSFSIGDDQNRRTVVCFKSKRKEQQMLQMGPNGPDKHPARGRSNDYASMPARSRESSRGRVKQRDPAPERTGSRRGKHPDQASHMPKPLRSKKRSAKQANSMPRSRSLHASPARPVGREPYYTDDDGNRKSEHDAAPPYRRKELSRSASMKDTRKSRSRPSSPPESVSRPKSKTLPRSPTEDSLRKRGQGLRLEGMVVNGDVEDPYNQDSDTELARSDAEAIKRERSHKRMESKKRPKSRRAKSEAELSDQGLPRNRRRSAHAASQNHGSENDSPVPNRKRSSSTNSRNRGKTYERRQEAIAKQRPGTAAGNERGFSDEESPYLSDEERDHRPRKNSAPDRDFDEDMSDASSETDVPGERERLKYRDLNNDELPPSYDKSSNIGSPASKARRNLNRIKRADSMRSHSPTNTERSPSNSSTRSDAASRYAEEAREPKQKSSTIPRQPNNNEGHSHDIHRSRTAPRKQNKNRAVGGDVAKRDEAGNVKPHKKSSKRVKSPQATNGVSAHSTPNKAHPNESRRNQREERAEVHRDPTALLKRPSDDNLLASEASLYMPLPGKLGAPAANQFVEPAANYTTPEHDYVNDTPDGVPPTRSVASQRAPPSCHSSLSSPVTDGSQGFNPRKEIMIKCDSEAQTDLTGTLPKRGSTKPSTLIENTAANEPPAVAVHPTQDSPSYHTQESSTPSNSTPSGPANEKLMEEFCKVMLNFQKMFIASQTSSAPQTDSSFSSPSHSHGPSLESFQPFAPYYTRSNPDLQAAAPTPPTALYNQFPPHIAHQLYLSWMAAYYAGATGSWPPPPPKMLPGKTKSSAPQHEYPPFLPMHGIVTNLHPEHMEERGKGDYNEPSGPQNRRDFPSFDENSDYYQPPVYFSAPKHNLEHPGEEFQPPSEPFSSVSGPESRGDWIRPNKTRANQTSKHVSKPARHGSSSTALTDAADTDVSSVTSSSTHPEVALKESKTGVMVYVRSGSQPNSRANSTVSGGEDVISLHSSSSHGLTIPVKAPPPASGLVNGRSGDADDEETPDPEVKLDKKRGKTGNSSTEKVKNEAIPTGKHTGKGSGEKQPVDMKGQKEPFADNEGTSRLPAKQHDPTKNTNGYDADRSTNLGSDGEDEKEEQLSVNRTNNQPSDENQLSLDKHVDGDIYLQEPQFDYYNWTPNKEIYSSAPYDGIVEIHDFPPEFKDNDILKHFKKIKGFKLVWVDDTHALGMFPSKEDAEAALKLDVPMMRLRPMIHASNQSRKKAKIRVEFGDYSSAPSKPRPETSNVVARKMVLGALGIKESQKDKEKRAELESKRLSKKKRI